MKCLTTLSVVGMLTCCALANAQTSTVRSGKWSSSSTWIDGVVPDVSSGVISINHKIIIPSDTLLTIDQVVVNDTLVVDAGAVVTLANGTSTDIVIVSGGLKVFGKIICLDGATFSGTTTVNTFFRSTSTYEHQYSTSTGEPPLATWHKNSTLEITGYVNSHSLNTAGWTQSFGNVTYNCTNQTASSFVEALGNLKDMKGNFHVKNTNGGVFRLTLDRTALNTINIGGDFIIEGRSEVWLSRAANTVINVGGNFEYYSTATASSYLTTTGTCQVNVAGDFKMNSIGILRFASATANGVGTLRVKSNVLFEAGQLAVLATGRGVLECNGTSQQTFLATGNSDAGITTVINNSTGVFIRANTVLGGDLQVTAGSLLIHPPGNVELRGNLTVDPGGDLRSNLGTLRLTGSSNQQLGIAGDTLCHLTINKSAGTSVTLNSAVNIVGTLLIQSPNTDLFSNGNLTLLSTSDTGTGDARVATLPSGSSILGGVTVRRFMSGEGRLYRYLSSPVRGATVADWQDDFPITGTFINPSTGPGIRSSSPSLYFYDETKVAWIPYPNAGMAEANKLVAGRGYSAYLREPLMPTTWDVTDTLNQGTVDLHVTYTNTDSVDEGWNLIGNPYPSSIDWNNPGWEKIKIENEIAVRDNGLGTFLYWDGAIGSLGSGRIAMGQAFWVQTNGENPSLKILEAAKTAIITPFYRSEQDELDFLELIVDRGDAHDRAYLRLRNNATQQYDPVDVVKWKNDFMNLSFESENRTLAIASTDVLDCSSVALNLSFTKKADGTFVKSPSGNYSLSLHAKGVFSFSNIELFDKYANQQFDLLAGAYSFTITNDSASFRQDRFSLTLSSSPVIQPVIEQIDSLLCGSSTAFQIQLNGLQAQVRYTLFINDQEVDTYLNHNETSLVLSGESSHFREEENTFKVNIQNACQRLETQRGKFYYLPELMSPPITEQNGLLYSNIDTEVQWYLNGEKIPAEIYPWIEPKISGQYRATTTLDQCEASASYDFIYQDEDVHCYPNPVDNIVTLIAPREEYIKGLSVLDCLGNSIAEFHLSNGQKSDSFLIADIPAGIYMLELITNKNKYTRKVLKK